MWGSEKYDILALIDYLHTYYEDWKRDGWMQAREGGTYIKK
jgi:hypothetical protein